MAEIAGLKLIVPTSVTADAGATASVSATGKVTFANISDTKNLIIEDCFTSSYDNYLIVMRVWDGAGDVIWARLRVGGSSDSGNNYVFQRLTAASTSVTGARFTSQSDWDIARDSAGTSLRTGCHWYIYGPNLAQPTAYRSLNADSSDNSARLYDYAGTHSLSTAYTSLEIGAGATDTDGSLTIYGMSQ